MALRLIDGGKIEKTKDEKAERKRVKEAIGIILGYANNHGGFVAFNSTNTMIAGEDTGHWLIQVRHNLGSDIEFYSQRRQYFDVEGV